MWIDAAIHYQPSGDDGVVRPALRKRGLCHV
jgi:hypothetical protein